MMRVIIIGASGLVGSHLLNFFQKNGQDCVGTYKTHSHPGLFQLDLSSSLKIKDLLARVQPDTILSTSALTNVDYCEENPEENWKQNVIAYQNLLDAINSVNPAIKLGFFSTDYIFDGREGPYSEEAQPNPINEYGIAKLAAERKIREQAKNYLILRTTIVFGFEFQRKNFAIRLIQENQKGVQMKVPVDQIGSPTYVEDLAAATYELASKSANGIFNVSGPELMSRYDFAIKICKTFNLKKENIVPALSQELKQKAKRPLKLGLNITKLNTFLQKDTMLSVEVGLHQMKKQMGL